MGACFVPDHPERVRDCSDKANYAYQSAYRMVLNFRQPDVFYLTVSFGFAKFTKWARSNSPKAIEISERAIRTAENRIARSLRSPPAKMEDKLWEMRETLEFWTTSESYSQNNHFPPYFV